MLQSSSIWPQNTVITTCKLLHPVTRSPFKYTRSHMIASEHKLIISLTLWVSIHQSYLYCVRQVLIFQCWEHNVPQTGDYKSYTWHILAVRGKSCGSSGLIGPQGDFHHSLRACVNPAGYFRSPSFLSNSKSTGGLKKTKKQKELSLPTKTISLVPRRWSIAPQQQLTTSHSPFSQKQETLTQDGIRWDNRIICLSANWATRPRACLRYLHAHFCEYTQGPAGDNKAVGWWGN